MPVEDAEQLLEASYKAEVAKRGATYEANSEVGHRIVQTAKWMTGNHKPGLILYGGVGSGKTTLMLAVRELVRLTHHSAMVSEAKVIRLVSALDLLKQAKDDPDRFERTKTSEMLAIDDLGIEPNVVKSWGNELSPVFNILYHRYDHQLLTIVTSNLDDAGLQEKYDLRIADRMREMFDKIACTAGSYRK